ncbi:hypothetical protein [Burkholderia gladioli]|uniref:hypothetical protein n=1 Tax=Burkholderia gladioli TaxID=28095 RepID=UPI001F36795B|nr:hypothetical protein [Burkholderia gladioli]
MGVFVAEDSGSPDKVTQQGKLAFDFGPFGMKGQRIATGQANVKAYNCKLRDPIRAGRVQPLGSSRTSCRWSRLRKATGT